MSVDPNQSPPLDEKKKNALMRYIFILFAVAFLLILLTFFMQLRDSNQTISELMQSNASAVQNAEKIQEENRLLLEQTAGMELELDEEAEDYEAEIQELTLQLSTAQDIQTALIEDSATLEEMVKDTLRVYESLISGENALTDGDISGAKAYANVVEESVSLLGNQGVDRYEALLVNIDLAENPPVETEEIQETTDETVG